MAGTADAATQRGDWALTRQRARAASSAFEARGPQNRAALMRIPLLNKIEGGDVL